jgi:hypothetical protein
VKNYTPNLVRDSKKIFSNKIIQKAKVNHKFSQDLSVSLKHLSANVDKDWKDIGSTKHVIYDKYYREKQLRLVQDLFYQRIY